MPPDAGFTLSELSALSDVPSRTIRYYIAQGLLPAPGREGPSTRYDEAFLARLRLIKQLRATHLPLAEIRKRLAVLSDEEAIALAETPAPEPPDGALDYVRALLGESGAPGARVPPAPSAPSAPLRLSSQIPERAPSYDMEPPPRMLLRRIEAMPRPAFPAEAAATQAPVEQAPQAPPLQSRAAQPSPSRPATPERSQWERIVLEPDVELHVRRPLTRHQNKRVERLVAFARELQEGDKS
jgi:DNA-binding transcriptional MerR regulator